MELSGRAALVTGGKRIGSAVAVLALLAVHAAIVPKLRSAFSLAGGLGLADTLPAPLLVGLVLGGGAVGLLGSALSVVRVLRRFRE